MSETTTNQVEVTRRGAETEVLIHRGASGAQVKTALLPIADDAEVIDTYVVGDDETESPMVVVFRG